MHCAAEICPASPIWVSIPAHLAQVRWICGPREHPRWRCENARATWLYDAQRPSVLEAAFAAHIGLDQVARSAAADEHDAPFVAGKAFAAVHQRFDAELRLQFTTARRRGPW